MQPVFGSIGIGLGIDFVGRASSPAGQTLVSSVALIDETEEGNFRVRWTFDHEINVTGADSSKFLIGGNGPSDTFSETNTDNVVLLYPSAIAGASTYELDAGHGVTSPGRTVPHDQTGALADNKVEVQSATFLDSETVDWTFSQDVTASENVFQLVVNGASPLATLQQSANVLRCTYAAVSPGDPWELSARPNNITPAADHYVLFPAAGTLS
jgi:hypothetical protein